MNRATSSRSAGRSSVASLGGVPILGIRLREKLMSASAMRLSRLALPMLSGMLCLVSSGDLSLARERGAYTAKGSPGQAIEVVRPVATVVGTMHYQAQLALNCHLSSCYGGFPKPGARRRLNVTRMTCRIRGPVGSSFGHGEVNLHKADDSYILSQYLPADHSGSFTDATVHLLNRAVDMQVRGSEYIYVYLQLGNGASPSSAHCTASGTLDKLQ